MKTTKTNADLTSNGLCHGCNLNQELKIRQLAKFTPVNANREEEELEKYRKYMERELGFQYSRIPDSQVSGFCCQALFYCSDTCATLSERQFELSVLLP